MELDLTGQLERSAVEPVSSDSSAAGEESGVKVNLELSLGWRSDDLGSRKRVREGDEAAEGKKPKMEGVVTYGLQMMPVIFRREMTPKHFLDLQRTWIFRNTMLPCLCAVVETILQKNRS